MNGLWEFFSNKPELYSLWRMRLRWAELLAVVGRESYKVSAALLRSCERAIKASKIVHRSSKAASTIIWIFFSCIFSPFSWDSLLVFSSLLFMSTHFGSSTVVGWNSIGDCGFSFAFISRCVVALNGIECWMNLLPRTFNVSCVSLTHETQLLMLALSAHFCWLV